MHGISRLALRKIGDWEEKVLYVYDDKVPKRRDAAGHLAYPEWDGGPVRGTLTVGIGHTDAAGAPKIVQGMRITDAEAYDILDADLGPCQRDVNTAVSAKLSQHQFDALVSFTFNCGAGNLRKLVAASGLNDGSYDQVPRHLLNYVSSKGERMQGLVNRRNAEIALWNTPDDPEAAAVHETFAPKAEENAAPKSMIESKTGGAAVTVGAGGVVASIQAANDAAAPIQQAKDTLHQLGLLDVLVAATHSPVFWIGLVIAAAAVFIWFDRRRRLQVDHV